MAELKNSTKRQLINTSTLGVGIGLVLAIFLIVNYFGWKYHQRLDWTGDKLHTLSEKSTQVLEALDKDVEAVVFMSPADPLFGSVSQLLGSYEAASPRLSVRYLDVEKNLAEAQSLVDKYEVNSLNVVVFDSSEDRRVVDATDLADFDYSGLQFGQQPRMTGFKGEQEFTSAIIDLVESRKPRVLFTAGHGELDLDDMSPDGISLARELLGKDNFELESWATVGEPAVPEGTDMLVVAGPTANFIEPEVVVMRNYIESGGGMLFLIDPTLAPAGGLVATGLEPLFEEYGVHLGDNIVVDPANPLPFFSADTIFVTAYAEHDITRSLSQAQLPVIVGLARSVGMGEPIEELRVTELMMTSVEGWGETDLEQLQQVELHEDDLGGPVPLAVAVEVIEEENLGAEALDGATASEEVTPSSPNLRLVVVGDSDFATNGQVQNMPNATFLANTLNWLVERETLIGIPPKKPEYVRLSLSSSQMSKVTWLVLVVLPGLAVLLGFAVYWQRRR
ncbi:MAG: GldG family protein [Thermoanaerobaculia bacterium]